MFIDRDGVICQNRSDYVRAWSEFEFVPGAIEAVASIRRARHRIFVATNQSAVGRGLLSRRQLDQIHERMLEVLASSGGSVEGVLVCPHHPDDACACRKPEPGLLLDAADRYKIDLGASTVIGDHRTDIEAGARAGCSTILVRTGRGATIADGAQTWTHPPDFVADDLIDAALWLLAQAAMRARGSSVTAFRGGEVRRR